ncbi:MAG: 50S ribosomal protein L25/general stress protein Ctc [Rhizomicrobium sp.]
MAQIKEIAIESRKGTGKGPSYQTRIKGRLPAIIYGGGTDPEPISVDAAELTRVLSKGGFLTTLFNLTEGGKVTRVLPRALQRDPVTDRPVHVDFMRMPAGSSVRLAIPIVFKGQEASPGLKRGGVLNIVRHKVDLICPADNIPVALEVSLAGLDINSSVHLDKLALPEGVRPADKTKDQAIASIVAPSGTAEAAATTTDAAAPAAAAPAAAAKK